MSEKYYGKLIIKVTANGCGLPLCGAEIFIDSKKFVVPPDKEGFSEIIEIFSSEIRGEKKYVEICAKCKGFEALRASSVPITSGYLTVWNMPLSPCHEKQ